MHEHSSDQDAQKILIEVFDEIPNLSRHEQVEERCKPCAKDSCSYKEKLLELAAKLSETHQIEEVVKLFKEAKLYVEGERKAQW
uniref:Uncharacterized protein n=1 Tax=Magnetococcus massalia (strain MO-1) TaxID=451514 RepID=A0A1S7LFU3_MAGMO|nr:conserved protein of unknown function [Candidatus Magnetococcus massalia]